MLGLRKTLGEMGNAGFGTWFPAPVTLSLSENSSSSSSAQCAKSEELITWKLERLLFLPEELPADGVELV